MRWTLVLAIVGVLVVVASVAAVAIIFLPKGPVAGPVMNPVHTRGPGPSPDSTTTPEVTIITTPAVPEVTAVPANSTTTVSPMKMTVPATSAPHGTVTPTVAGSPPFPTPAGPAQGDSYTISEGDLAGQIHTLINRQRAANGLNGLGTDAALVNLALNHSEDMAANNYFAHENPAGQDPTARGESAGYICRKDYGSYYTYGIAENIFQNNRYSAVTYYSDGRYVYDWNAPDTIAQSTVDGWMNSPGHRKNILTATFDREGIGVAIANDDKIYITEDFC